MGDEQEQETIWQGLGVSPGVAEGEVVVHWQDEEEIPLRDITPGDIPGEITRFESALIATRQELLDIQQKIAGAIGADDASIFDAHLLVVEDRTLIDEALRGLERDLHNIEFVFHQVAEKYCRTLAAIDDPYLQERVVDIEDVTRRVVRHLLGKSREGLHKLDRPHIIVARNLTPSDTAMINRSDSRPRRTAARVPRTTPRGTAQIRLASISSMVGPTVLASSLTTAVFEIIERPRSPCSTRLR